MNGTNHEIINDLKRENNSAFGRLYKEHFSMVRYFVIRNSGTGNDAEDVFQDTMMILVRKLRQENFVLTASLKTYIMAIAKNIWLKQLNAKAVRQRETILYNDAFFASINQSIEQDRTYWDKLQTYLTRITHHCRGLIHDMFFRKKTIQQIQQEYGYSTKHNAQNQKHKCIEQIRKVKEQDKGNT